MVVTLMFYIFKINMFNVLFQISRGAQFEIVSFLGRNFEPMYILNFTSMFNVLFQIFIFYEFSFLGRNFEPVHMSIFKVTIHLRLSSSNQR
jgi:hypothetical protein